MRRFLHKFCVGMAIGSMFVIALLCFAFVGWFLSQIGINRCS